jgi:hypothetical protein
MMSTLGYLWLEFKEAVCGYTLHYISRVYSGIYGSKAINMAKKNAN